MDILSMIHRADQKEHLLSEPFCFLLYSRTRDLLLSFFASSGPVGLSVPDGFEKSFFLLMDQLAAPVHRNRILQAAAELFCEPVGRKKAIGSLNTPVQARKEYDDLCKALRFLRSGRQMLAEQFGSPDDADSREIFQTLDEYEANALQRLEDLLRLLGSQHRRQIVLEADRKHKALVRDYALLPETEKLIDAEDRTAIYRNMLEEEKDIFDSERIICSSRRLCNRKEQGKEFDPDHDQQNEAVDADE